MLELGVLGPLTVCTGRGRTALAAAMPRRLLAVLTCRAGQYVPVDALIDSLWRADPPPTARKTLQVYVRRLRQMLDDDRRICHHAASYRLVLGPGELDADRFDDLVRLARAARDRANPLGASCLFDRALALWRGEPYADVADLALVNEEAVRLADHRLQTQEDRFETDLELGRHVTVVPDLGRLSRGNPYRERLRGLLMLALYRSGRQTEALEAFRDTRALFADELGIEPGPALRNLHERILRADPDLDRSSLPWSLHSGLRTQGAGRRTTRLRTRW